MSWSGQYRYVPSEARYTVRDTDGIVPDTRPLDWPTALYLVQTANRDARAVREARYVLRKVT